MAKSESEEYEQVRRQLREHTEGGFRLAAEEDEYWAMKQARRGGTLSEVAYDAMSRGDLVEVWSGTTTFRGFIRHTRNDLLMLSGQANVDVNLGGPIVLRIVEAAATTGVGVVRHGAASFAARLAELEQAQTTCEFICPFARAPVNGKLMIRARDHVIVGAAAGGEWIVPVRWLAAVVNH